MRRLRFYRILLPAIFIVFVVLVVRELKPMSGVHTQTLGPMPAPGSKARNVTAVDIEGGRKNFQIEAGSIEEVAGGRIDLEDVRSLEIYRDEMLPLIIRALSGHIEGDPGQRVFTFDREVSIEDPDRGLTLHIPALEIDEASGVARSTEAVQLTGDRIEGRAETLIYHVEGQPAELGQLFLEAHDGSTVQADRALLHDGMDDVELIDRVRATRGEEFLDADHLRTVRGPEDQMKSMVATGNVESRMLSEGGAFMDLISETLDLRFDDAGRPRTLELTGGAQAASGPESLSADLIQARRLDTVPSLWRVRAQGRVQVRGMFDLAPAMLRAQTLTGVATPELQLREAAASGRVMFDAPNTRAEADQARFRSQDNEIRLFGSARRKARLARFRTRVAAEEISTDTAGNRLAAHREVEATMLPGDGPGSIETGLFDDDEAIHFVSRELYGEQGGSRLTFEGAVRGWQGDRTLSAELIRVDQNDHSLHAEENVAARIPRLAEGGGAGESEYIQISSNALDYTEADRRAVFHEQVRVRVVEGWMESARVEIDMGETGEVDELRAAGGVRLEFREPEKEGGLPELVSGTADRVIYRPATRTVWLIGDDSPAKVRRIGVSEGTTSGRVLRYDLGQGTLEVDSGEGGPARIRTSGGPNG